MLINDENIQQQVLAAVNNANRLISDVAEEFGLSRKQVYFYLKNTQQLDRRSSAQKEKALRTKMAKLNEELNTLQYTQH